MKRLLESNTNVKLDKTSEFEDIEISQLVDKIKKDENLKSYYKNLLSAIQAGTRLTPGKDFPSEFISLFEANNIIR